MIKITIGDFTFTEFDDHSLWMSKECGEGMQVSYKMLEDLLNKFWEENF